MFRDEGILPWLERLRAEVPGLELVDAHTHIGCNDPDGYRSEPEDLIRSLAAADARGVVFPMHEPHGYRQANDRVIAAAAGSDGRLAAFCRLDPHHEDALAEAERCLDSGAAGIKLHPRAEEFPLDLPAIESVFALAHERRRPILCHAGRGIPALGRHAVELCGRYPGARLILAHAGISDLSWIWRQAPELPNLFFDTAWWSPSDLLALFALVPPGQVLLASDAPYATPAFGATTTLRYALQTGLTAEQIRCVGGEQTARLLAGEDPVDAGPAPGSAEHAVDHVLDRVYGFLMASVGQMFNGLDAQETLSLAALGCEVGDDAPQAEVCRVILSLIEARERLDPADEYNPRGFGRGLSLVIAAAAIARTPDVALPEPLEPADVSERVG